MNELDDAFTNVRRHLQRFPIYKESPACDVKINKEQLTGVNESSGADIETS